MKRIFITIAASIMFIMCATLLTVTTYTGSLFVARIADTFTLDDVNILLTLRNVFQLSAIAFSVCMFASLLFVLPVETYKVWKKD